MGTSKNIPRILLLAALFLAIMFGGKLLEPPAVRASNTADQFDTARAFSRIETILGDETPHPVDSAANAAVRDRLIAQIESLGFIAETSTGASCNPGRATYFLACAHVTNVSFRMGPMPTPGAKDTIMVTTHYDSVPAGPGAGDASLGTATLLEIAAVLKGKTLERPLLFMFTDGEEGGLMGAHYFVRDDPRADEVQTIVNFEARGNRGPAYMFETSRPNGRVIPAYAKTAKRPSANSVMSAVYEIIPNTTDVAVYLPKGYEALNFAVVDGYANYHTPHDNLENLSRRSLQHMGDQGLSAVLSLASEAASTNDGHYLYADILTRFMVVMPVVAAVPILGLALLVAMGLFWMATPKQSDQTANPQTKKTKIVLPWRAAIAPPLAIAIGAFVMWILQGVINLFRSSDPYWWANGWATQGLAAALAFLAALAVLRTLCPRATPAQMTFAGWSWFFIPGMICASALPGAMILFVLPAIGFLVASGFWIAFRDPRKGLFNTPLGWTYGLAALFVLIGFIPLFSALGITLGYAAGWMFVAVFGIALLPAFGAFTPAWHYDGTITIDPPVWMTSVVTLGFFGAALFLPAATRETPRPQNVMTVIDANMNTAHIAFTHKNKPDVVSKTLFKDLDTRDLIPDSHAMWSVPAALSDLYSPPELSDIRRTYLGNDTIEIWAKIRMNGADRIGIRVPKSSGPLTASFWDITAPLTGETSNRKYVTLRCAGQSCDGATIGFKLKKDAPAAWIIYGEHFKTSDAAQPFVDARPDTATSIQSGDHTLVFRKQTP